jgi:hypothetical protein
MYFISLEMHSLMGYVNYWLGGSDDDCEGKFGWCDLDQPLANWTKVAPLDNRLIENYVYLDQYVGVVKPGGSISTFRDDGHFKKKLFICEV